MSKRIVEKTTRRQEDAVTHEMIETELSPVQRANSMMRYVAIDIETTGLDPSTCQILEFAAVVESHDWTVAVEDLPRMSVVIDPGEVITGSPFALAMNHDIVKQLAVSRHKRTVPWYPVEDLGLLFREFVNKHLDGTGNSKITVAGKNVATFDLRFLERVPNWPTERIRHRVLDVGSLWFRPEDSVIPDTAECKKRSGLDTELTHRALADCLNTIRMVRKRFA